MKIKLDVKLKDFVSGQTIKSEEGDLTLQKAIINSLLVTLPQENLTGTEKFNLYELAKKANSKAEGELTAEEIAKIKDRVGKVYGANVVGCVYDLLEGK